MESQMHRHHHREDDPHTTGEGEKKSVLKKVKEKVKKMKDTIKKHGDGDGHEHEHDHPHISEEEDEEMVNDPEVHGAPMYESAVITGTKLPIQTGFNLEKPTDKGEDRCRPNVKNEVYTSQEDKEAARASGVGKMGPELGSHNPNVKDVTVTTNPTGPAKLGPELGSYKPEGEDVVVTNQGPELGSYNPNVEDKEATTSSTAPGKIGSGLGGHRGPNAEDPGVTTKLGPGKFELRSYHNPNIEGEGVKTMPSGPAEMGPESGSYGIGRKNEVYPNVEGRGVTNLTSGPGKMETESERQTVEAREAGDQIPIWSSPYTIDVETANVEEPAVKIGQLEAIEEDPHAPRNLAGEIPVSNYESKVTDPTHEGGKEADVAPLAKRFDNLHVRNEPVPEHKSYTGSHDQFAPQTTPTEDQFAPGSSPITPSESLESPKVYDLADPGSMPYDTIAEKISSATSVVADKAIAAKNVVASKLAYTGEHQETEDDSRKPVSESATEYAQKVAEKLAPVYEKVAGTGSVILSKVQGGGGMVEENRDTAVGEADKGVSVKEYLAVKLSPGDEDKALPEEITEALHKKEEGMEGEKTVVGGEDVAARLENKGEGEDVVAAGSESSTGGAVDGLKEAVGSLFGKRSQHEQDEDAGRQRRLQESGN